MSKKELKKSRRCKVCGKEVPEREWFSINAGVTGDVKVLWGHPACVNNVDELVVLPNRLDFYRMIEWISFHVGASKISKLLEEYDEWMALKENPASVAGPEDKDVPRGKHRPGTLSSGNLRTPVAGKEKAGDYRPPYMAPGLLQESNTGAR
jgi:hypothetical protein